jgi:AFG3 family protein
MGVAAILASLSFGHHDHQQIIFQEFKNNLLDPGFVDHIEDSNKVVVKAYVNIGSVDSFERKLEKSQEDLGIDPHDYVPVTYISELSFLQEVISLIPTALVIETLVYLNRRFCRIHILLML